MTIDREKSNQYYCVLNGISEDQVLIQFDLIASRSAKKFLNATNTFLYHDKYDCPVFKYECISPNYNLKDTGIFNISIYKININDKIMYQTRVQTRPIITNFAGKTFNSLDLFRFDI